jgi:hypothetical protein
VLAMDEWNRFDLDANRHSHSNLPIPEFHGRRMTMAALRFLFVALLSLAIGASLPQFGHASEPDKAAPNGAAAAGADDNAAVTSVYPLWKMGYDLELSKWIAETIPDVVEPSTWQSVGGCGVARYNSANGILVVRHSKEVHAKVENFLKDVKQSMPTVTAGATTTGQRTQGDSVIPAAHQAPSPIRTSNATEDEIPPFISTSKKSPKHLLHLTIHYEGEGIIDDNVLKYLKSEMDGKPSYSGPACEVPPPPSNVLGRTGVCPSKAPEVTGLPTQVVEVAPAPTKVKDEAKEELKDTIYEKKN